MKKLKLFDIFNYIFMSLFVISIVYPFWDMLLKSFSTPVDAMKLGFRIIPKFNDLTIDAYSTIFKEGRIGIGYYNTIFRTVIGTILMIMVTMGASYPLSKRKLPYRSAITFYLVITMFFSGGIIPSYLLITWLHLNDTLWALILPGTAAVFNMILVRNYIMAVIDQSMEESAQMDGANHLVILYKIIIPLSKPAIAVIGLWSIVGHWNSWFDAMLYTNSPNKEVLQLMLRKILIEFSSQDMKRFADMAGIRKAHSPESLKAAFLYLTITPILCIYPFLQKYFVKGIMLGALKG